MINVKNYQLNKYIKKVNGVCGCVVIHKEELLIKTKTFNEVLLIFQVFFFKLLYILVYNIWIF